MARVKKKSYENLTDVNIERVIALLNPTSSTVKAITKKEGCEILNIAYNTARLTKVLADYEERKTYELRRKSINKGKAATAGEIKEAITFYLQGDTVSDISKGMYRSASFVKAILERIGVPQRPASAEDRAQNAYLPESCVAEEFVEKEIVWSAAHHAPAEIKARLDDSKYIALYGVPCYQIYIPEKVDSSESLYSNTEVGGFNAYSPAYDLGKLEHLQEYGVDLQKV